MMDRLKNLAFPLLLIAVLLLLGPLNWAKSDGVNNPGVRSATIAAGTGLSVAGTCTITSTGTCTVSPNNAMGGNKLQVFTTGSGTYTTPTGANWIKVTLIGAGGGGAGGGATATDGGNGGNTCWNTSGAACTTPVYQAGGGALGSYGTAGSSAGGTVSGSGTCTYSFPGGGGTPDEAITTTGANGTDGGNNSIFSGGGKGAYRNGTAGVGVANSGGGGAGGGISTGATNVGGGSGAAGASCVVLIQSPAATYTYAIGAAGSAGAAGTSGANGGTGSAGFIVVEAGFN